MNEPWTRDEAFEVLEDGHAILTVEGAQDLCNILGVTLDPEVILTWQDAKQAKARYGIFVVKDEPGSGVAPLDMGYAICRQLGIDPPPGRGFTGKGFQARANAQAIKEKLTQV